MTSATVKSMAVLFVVLCSSCTSDESKPLTKASLSNAEKYVRGYDSNGDGCLDFGEFQRSYRENMDRSLWPRDKEMFDGFDNNHDKQICPSEILPSNHGALERDTAAALRH